MAWKIDHMTMETIDGKVITVQECVIMPAAEYATMIQNQIDAP